LSKNPQLNVYNSTVSRDRDFGGALKCDIKAKIFILREEGNNSVRNSGLTPTIPPPITTESE